MSKCVKSQTNRCLRVALGERMRLHIFEPRYRLLVRTLQRPLQSQPSRCNGVANLLV
jgi:hypothetical protein